MPWAPPLGAALFGFVVGWVTYRTLRRKGSGAAISDIAAVIGAVGGATVTTLFKAEELFGLYAIGLAVGFFGYLIVNYLLDPGETKGWLGGE
jgi:uncharacterized membrane protein YeaQ/YmgE (transglycosylase-associated protein family)